MFENYRTFETTFAGRKLMVETGKTCELSNGSCWVHYGETVVMANVTASDKPREGVDFFRLTLRRDFTLLVRSPDHSPRERASPQKRLYSPPVWLTDLSVLCSPRI